MLVEVKGDLDGESTRLCRRDCSTDSLELNPGGVILGTEVEKWHN